MPPPPLTRSALATWLLTCPPLQGLSPEAAERLATWLRPRAYNREHIFPASRLDQGDQPLRIIWSGTVAWSVIGGDRPMRAPLRAGQMLGTPSVHGWAFHGRPCPLDPATTFTVETTTLDPTVVYELQPEDFGAALGTDPTQDPLRAVLASAHRGAWAGQALYALWQLDELGAMRADQLAALMVRGEILRVAADELVPGLEVDEQPSCMHAQLDGLIQRTVPQSGGPSLEQNWGISRPGAVLGGSEIFDGAQMAWNARALEDVHLLRIPREALVEAPRRIPGWLRSVREAVGMPQLYRDDDTPFNSASWWVVVPAARTAGVPLWCAVDSLALASAERLHDNVLVLHLDPGAPRPPIDPPDPAGPSVRHVQISPVDLDEPCLAGLIHESWDLVLVDPSAFASDAQELKRILGDLAALPVPFRATGLFELRADWEPLLDLMPTSMRSSALPARITRGDGRGGNGSALLSMVRERIEESVPLGSALLAPLKLWARGATAGLSLARESYQQEAALLGAGTTQGTPSHPALPVGTARIFLRDALAQRMAGSARASFPDGWPAEARSALMDAFAFWARGVTRRRVGVALGGAGALSYTGAAMLLALEQRGVPVDVISGTSFGSVVGAFYAVEGPAGLRRLPHLWASLLAALSSTSMTTAPLQAWAACQLGDIALDALQIQLMPVGTVASNLQEWDVRGGTVARGLRVSGSLPPFAPTMLGKLRLLDGGYAADVPCQALVDEGCDLIIAVNPYPRPPVREGPGFWIPFVSRCLQEMDPWLRMSDSMRCYQLLWRFAAGRQDYLADVVYAAEDVNTLPMAFWQGEELIDNALRSDELFDASEDASEQWASMIGKPRLGAVALMPVGAGSGGGSPAADAPGSGA